MLLFYGEISDVFGGSLDNFPIWWYTKHESDADKKIYIQSAFQMDNDKKESSELASLLLTKDFFKKCIVRMDIPHNFYDDNGIFHCNLIDLLLGRVELF